MKPASMHIVILREINKKNLVNEAGKHAHCHFLATQALLRIQCRVFVYYRLRPPLTPRQTRAVC